MDFKGIAKFPLVTTKIVDDAETLNYILVSSWVRVKRNKRYYYVLIQQRQDCHKIRPMLIVNTINMCLKEGEKVKYLWLLPKESLRIHMKANGSLIYDNKHFSNKELTLLNVQPYNI